MKRFSIQSRLFHRLAALGLALLLAGCAVRHHQPYTVVDRRVENAFLRTSTYIMAREALYAVPLLPFRSGREVARLLASLWR